MKYGHYLIIACLSLLGITALLFIYWSLQGVWFDKYPSQIYVKTEKILYHSGDDVVGDRNICSEIGKYTTIELSLLDTFLRTYQKRSSCYFDAKGTRDPYLLEPLSPTLPSGSYNFNGNVAVRINPIKVIYVEIISNRFYVENNSEE